MVLKVDDGSPQQLVDTASIPGVVGEVWGWQISIVDMECQSVE